MVALRDYVNLQPTTEISAAAKAEINRQLAEIGLPGRPGVDPGARAALGVRIPFRSDIEFGAGLLPPEEVRKVGGEIGQIRQSLRDLKREPQD
jgi:hypothetical protein